MKLGGGGGIRPTEWPFLQPLKGGLEALKVNVLLTKTPDTKMHGIQLKQY